VGVVHGKTARVVVKAPHDAIDKLVVENRARTLILDKGGLGNHPHAELKASIITPMLTDLGVKGLVRLDFSGFHADRLSIRTDGATTLTGRENRIRELHLSGEGMTDINLKENPVTSADVRYEGMYTIRLSMTGGTLSGSIKGLGKILYDGHVREERIQRRGRCEVRHE